MYFDINEKTMIKYKSVVSNAEFDAFVQDLQEKHLNAANAHSLARFTAGNYGEWEGCQDGKKYYINTRAVDGDSVAVEFEFSRMYSKKAKVQEGA